MPSKLTVLLVSLLLATPAVIFSIWLVIQRARVTILCPEGCRCGATGYNVTCTNTPLTAVHSIRLKGVRELRLINNNITLLERGVFLLSGLTELESLRVEGCGVRTVELGAFKGLTELKGLSLSGNKLREIIPGTFGDMSKLEYLSLWSNRLENLDSTLFSGLDNLCEIDLRENELQYVHPDTFLVLPKLQRLYLSSNLDLQIPTDSNFINSHSLSHLDISLCNVRSLSVETFTNVSALERLDLSYNNLRTVDINILRVLLKLSGLYLYGNRLQCDCQLHEVWQWCEDRNITTGVGGDVPECDTPSEVKGLGWGLVFEEGQCVQGNIEYYEEYESTSYNYNNNEDWYWDMYDF